MQSLGSVCQNVCQFMPGVCHGVQNRRFIVLNKPTEFMIQWACGIIEQNILLLFVEKRVRESILSVLARQEKRLRPP